jgi:hypothetical protein
MIKVKVQTSDYSELFNKIKKQTAANQDRITRRWASECAVEVKKLVLSEIASGTSPVLHKKAFKEYSALYKKQIKKAKGLFSAKKIKPVNLKLSGEMLDSAKSEAGRDYFTTTFTSEIAEYHNNKGAGKSKVIRRMLPIKGERFNLRISTKIEKILRDSIKLVVGR